MVLEVAQRYLSCTLLLEEVTSPPRVHINYALQWQGHWRIWGYVFKPLPETLSSLAHVYVQQVAGSPFGHCVTSFLFLFTLTCINWWQCCVSVYYHGGLPFHASLGLLETHAPLIAKLTFQFFHKFTTYRWSFSLRLLLVTCLMAHMTPNGFSWQWDD